MKQPDHPVFDPVTALRVFLLLSSAAAQSSRLPLKNPNLTCQGTNMKCLSVFRVLVALCCCSYATTLLSADATPPNILVVLFDDMGFSDLGCYGGEIETPNIDRLAENGLRFTQFYNTTRCWPTRTALMTGFYPQQVRSDPPQGKLPQGTALIPHYLQTAGYRCYTGHD